MATARRTPVNPNTATFGGAGQGRDHTTFSDWETTTQGNLVADNAGEILNCFDDDASYDQSFTVSGSSADATRFRVVQKDSSVSWNGTESNGIFIDDIVNGQTLSIAETDFGIQQIVLKHTENSTSGVLVINVGGSGTRATVIQCIIFDSLNSGAGTVRGIKLAAADQIMVLCLVDTTDSHCVESKPGTSNTAYLYNCTLQGSTRDGINNANGICIAKNVISDNNSEDDYDAGTYTGSSHTSSEDLTGDDPDSTNGKISQSFTFVSTTDFHFTAGSDGEDDGTDLSGDSFFAFDEDIDDDTITTWMRGFDRTVAVSARRTPQQALLGVGR